MRLLMQGSWSLVDAAHFPGRIYFRRSSVGAPSLFLWDPIFQGKIPDILNIGTTDRIQVADCRKQNDVRGPL
jgi:hypothetical protein